MKEINPIRLIGNWTEGYALDYHTVYILLSWWVMQTV